MKIPRVVPRYQGSPIAVAACLATVLASACGSSTSRGLDAHESGGENSGGTG